MDNGNEDNTNNNHVTILNSQHGNSINLSSSSPSSSSSSSSYFYLYFSYFLSAWGDRMWEFASIVFLLELFPNTLLPPSLFGFIETSAGILGSSAVGKFIDRTNRLKTIRISIVGQNINTGAATILLYFGIENRVNWSNAVLWSIFSFLVLFGIGAKLLSSMNKISIHKDWIIVLADKNSLILTRLNASMRRIDLICSIAAPLLVGLVSTVISPSVACLVIGIWNFLSMFIEYKLCAIVYYRFASLQIKESVTITTNANTADNDPDNHNPNNANNNNSSMSTFSTFRAYFNHPVLLASLAYSCLYISVLSFGGIMVSYLKTVGLTDILLAAGRAIAAFIGVLATFSTPSMVKSQGLLKSGLITIFSQLLCLIPLFFGFLLLSSDSFNFLLIIFICLCLSRFGLWGFDMIQTQIMQENILIKDTGKINAAQETFINTGYLISFALTIIFSDPKQFIYPAFISLGSIIVATTLFTVYAVKNWRNQEPNANSNGEGSSSSSSNNNSINNLSSKNEIELWSEAKEVEEEENCEQPGSSVYHMHVVMDNNSNNNRDKSDDIHYICNYHSHSEYANNLDLLKQHLLEEH